MVVPQGSTVPVLTPAGGQVNVGGGTDFTHGFGGSPPPSPYQYKKSKKVKSKKNK